MNKTRIRALKLVLFVLCLVPFASLVWRAFGVGDSDLGTNPIEKVQDTLGQWGLRFLLITLAVTPLRDLLNAPWLVQLRRLLGLYAFFYVLMHFLAWFVLDQDMYWSGITTDIARRPFITVGFTALLLLIPLAITSTNAMMRRLGKRWKALHRLIYVIAPLGVVHYYWQVKADVREPLVYATILTVLLGWRVYKSRKRPQKRTEPAEKMKSPDPVSP